MQPRWQKSKLRSWMRKWKASMGSGWRLILNPEVPQHFTVSSFFYLVLVQCRYLHHCFFYLFSFCWCWLFGVTVGVAIEFECREPFKVRVTWEFLLFNENPSCCVITICKVPFAMFFYWMQWVNGSSLQNTIPFLTTVQFVFTSGTCVCSDFRVIFFEKTQKQEFCCFWVDVNLFYKTLNQTC